MAQSLLTIDFEEWYELKYSLEPAWQNHSFESRVQANMEVLLACMAKNEAQATFFFLGSVAEKHPNLVRHAQQMGHEIASHGYGHQLVYNQTREEFSIDVKKSLDILQDITGQPIIGYRAPFWSISKKKTPWAYEVLSELGLVYDASLFPFQTHLYGDSDAPIAPFIMHINGRKLYEIPATVLQLGPLRLPFGGGFYFRLMPYWITRLATYFAHYRKQSVVFYLHPREIDPNQPRLPLSPRDYFVAYVNLNSTLQKLNRILATMATISVSRYLELYACEKE